ncbi:MAG: class I SAM-dependent methyltransferase [Bacteriovoracaceae bacterium]|jgi:ubiquinone/menaquinone biosynthesis C-methylase UbiE|nr:class I SAM-dependent methyltransferase [Bacteriovoracaceae bacterium]
MSSQKKENTDNLKYKEFIHNEIKRDKESFCPIRRERQFNFLWPKIKENISEGRTSFLDLCCGHGRLIHFLEKDFSYLKIHGIDYVEEFINDAKEKFANNSNITFELGDAFNLSEGHKKKFDCTINYKTLSWLPYYTRVIEEMIKVTKSRIYITSLFWDGDIDFITKIYNNASENDQTHVYLNTYSLPKFKNFCLNKGAKEVLSTDMRLDIDIEQKDNQNELHTFTRKLETGDRIELTGAVALNWKLIEIVL